MIEFKKKYFILYIKCKKNKEIYKKFGGILNSCDLKNKLYVM